MADVHEPEVRSYNMSRIRGKDTMPEMLVRRFLFSRGFRYRLHDRNLPGKPDLVLPHYKTVIQVHGCFWHAHRGCKDFKIPDHNRQWWKEKLTRNADKDVSNEEALRELGWRVVTIWECELKPRKRDETLKNLLLNLDPLKTSEEIP
jgi:DNA mismatch endonuclease, patch repair protein